MEAYSGRGNAYDELKQYDLAIADWSKMIELFPDDAQGYNNRGISYTSVKKYDLAIADYLKILELRPDYAYGYNNLAFVYLLQKSKELAQQNAEKSKELMPEIKSSDLKRGGAGVRAMACDRQGNLLDDFLILEQKNIINVCNTPSPAATASLAIGEMVMQRALKQLEEK